VLREKDSFGNVRSTIDLRTASKNALRIHTHGHPRKRRDRK